MPIGASTSLRRQASSQGRAHMRPETPGEDIVLAVQLVAVGVAAVGDQRDIARNIGVRRAGRHARDIVGKPLRVAGVNRIALAGALAYRARRTTRRQRQATGCGAYLRPRSHSPGRRCRALRNLEPVASPSSVESIGRKRSAGAPQDGHPSGGAAPSWIHPQTLHRNIVVTPSGTLGGPVRWRPSACDSDRSSIPRRATGRCAGSFDCMHLYASRDHEKIRAP